MNKKPGYGYIIRDTEGVIRICSEGYRTRKDAEDAAGDALAIMPKDSSVEIQYVEETPAVYIPYGAVIH